MNHLEQFVPSKSDKLLGPSVVGGSEDSCLTPVAARQPLMLNRSGGAGWHKFAQPGFGHVVQGRDPQGMGV